MQQQFEYVPVSINCKVETEEVLGPLPSNWEKAPWGKTGRHFFVDHNERTTTWVDPRTFHLRKHDIRDVVEGELPFGWEECYDKVAGTYYIDHVTQAHHLDAPWTESVQQQYLAQQSDSGNEDSKKLMEQMEHERAMQAELEAAEAKLELLLKEKERLESEIAEVEESLANPETQEQEEELSQHQEALNEELELVNSQIERERLEVEQVRSAHDNMVAEIEAFQQRLHELKAVNERLEQENAHVADENGHHQANLEDMRNMIELEATQRNALESYIKQLKSEVLQLYNPDDADDILAQEELQRSMSKHVTVDAPLPEIGTLDEDTLRAQLSTRLEHEKEERERLRELTENLEKERLKASEGSEGELPSWIKELDITELSSSVKVKIVRENQEIGFVEEAQAQPEEEPEQPEEEDEPEEEEEPEQQAEEQEMIPTMDEVTPSPGFFNEMRNEMEIEEPAAEVEISYDEYGNQEQFEFVPSLPAENLLGGETEEEHFRI